MEKKISIKKYFTELGKKGGTATFKKRGKDYMSELGKKGMKKRWGKKRGA